MESSASSATACIPALQPSRASTPSSDTHIEATEVNLGGKEELHEATDIVALDITIPAPPAYVTLEVFLDHLLEVAKHGVDVDKLIQSTRTSFRLIENWCEHNSHSGNPIVVTLCRKVKPVFKDYSKAINTSVKTAEGGFAFADDAVGLCEYLARHLNTDVRSYIEEMQQKAKNAHSDAEDTYEKFKAVRASLIQIAKSFSPSTEQDLTDCTRLQDSLVNLLQNAVQDLTKIVGCVGDFVNWWARVETNMFNIKNKVSANNGKLCLLQIDVLRDRCEAVRKDYLTYKTSIAAVKDFYPSDKNGSWLKRWLSFLTKPDR